MRPGCLCSLLVLTSLLATPAAAGKIHGTLSMSPGALAAARRGGAATAHAVQRGAADAVIYLERIHERDEKKLARSGFLFFRGGSRRPPRLVQVNKSFQPHVLSVAAGTSVVFQNMDRVYHNAFSVSPAKRFDLGKYPPGRSDTVRFDRPGVVNLHCDIHAGMLGFVVVTPNHAFTRPDSTGRYQLPKLSPGTYTVRVFHPRRGELRRKVELPHRGDVTLDLNF
jgi:hypothetical protein